MIYVALLNGVSFSTNPTFSPTLGVISPHQAASLSNPAQLDSGLIDSGPPALGTIPSDQATPSFLTSDHSSALMEESDLLFDVPPGLQVTHHEFQEAVSQTLREFGGPHTSLQVGGGRIHPLELSQSYLVRNEESSEILSTRGNYDDSDWRYRPPSRQSQLSQLSSSSLRDLMGELLARIGRPMSSFGRSVISRLRPGRPRH